MAHRLLCALLCLAPFAAAAEDGVDAWIARLRADSAQERLRAERWLALHLTPQDYPALARAAERGDAEVRRRLRAALASEDRHLALACLLLTEPDPALAALGAAAFDELALRWCPGADGEPAERQQVLAALAREDTVRFRIAPESEPVALPLERLDRLADLGLPLVIAPELADRAPVPRGPLEGTATRLLAELARLEAAAIVGVGDFSDDEPGPGAWVHVSTLGAARAGDGLRWLRRWCERVQRAEGPDAGAAASARALAASGWPAALGWLESRWLGRRDVNALSGLLYAAERGRVAPGLCAPGERTRVLELADRALATPGSLRRAERSARALAVAGAASPTGEDPALELVAGWSGLAAGPRWLRLVALEGTRSADPRVLAVLRGVLEGTEAPPGLRLQALRALAALPPGPDPAPRVAGLEALFEHAREEGRAAELAGLLVSLGGDPLAASSAAGLPEAPAGSARALFALELAYLSGDPGTAARLARELRAGAADRRALGERVSGWVARDGPRRAAALVEAAAAELPEGARAELARFALRCGCLGPEGQVALFAELEAADRPTVAELELFGALAAGPRGQSARARLLDELRRVGEGAAEGGRRQEALVEALERAAESLRRSFQDELAGDFARAVQGAVALPGHPLRARLRPPQWPPPVLPPARPLELSDRRLPEGL